MFVQFSAALALFATAEAATWSQQYPSYNNYGDTRYNSQNNYNNEYTFPWARRSTYRPRDVTVFNRQPVSNYWNSFEKSDEIIKASCEFDFIGYSETTGRVNFTQAPGDLVSMIGEFKGLNPGLHALKITEFGDLEYGCESLGDVYNPFDAPHGDSHQDITERRAGDIEQVQARYDTTADYLCRDHIAEMQGPNSIIGRSLTIYERADDHTMTEHPGIEGREERIKRGAGRRIGCCVIGLAKGEQPKAAAPEPAPKPVHQHVQHQHEPVYRYEPRYYGNGGW